MRAWHLGGYVLAMVAASGCVNSDVVRCADGVVCPSGTVCADAIDRCVLPEQLLSCVGAADATECEIPGGDGICVGEVCVEERCGDSVVTGNELCDPQATLATDEDDCSDHSYREGGAVTCRGDCTFDLSGCTSICGDDELNGDDEQCDGPDLGGLADCQDLDFYDPAPLTCNGACRYEVSPCTGFCGDDIPNGPETCDGARPDNLSCLDVFFDAGVLECSGQCIPDTAGCGIIGWRTSSGTGATLGGLWATPDGQFFAGNVDGGTSAVHRYDGTTWSVMATPSVVTVSSIAGTDATDLYAAADRKILHFDGTAWSLDAEVSDVVNAIWPLAAGDAFAVTTSGQILRRGVGGWTEVVGVDEAALNALWGSATDDVYAVGDGGRMLHYDGTSWRTQVLGTTDFQDVWGSGPDDVYAVGNTGANLTVRHFDGSIWKSSTMPPTPPSRTVSIWGHDEHHVYVTTDDRVLGWDGSTWSVYLLQPFAELATIAGTGVDHIVVLGAGSTVYEYRGRHWRSFSNVFVGTFPSVWGSADDDVYVGGIGGVRRFDGTAWPTLTIPIPFDPPHCEQFWGTGPADVFCTYSGRINHFDGSAWTQDTLSADAFSVNDIWGAGPRDVYATDRFRGIYHFDGQAWTLLDPTLQLQGVWGSGPSDVFVVGQLGVIRHFDGATWTAQTTPTPQSLEAIWGSGPADVFAVGDSGTILHYDGNTWSPQATPTFGDLRDIWGYGPDDVFAIGSSQVLHYDGVEWSRVRAPAAGESFHSLWGVPRRTFVVSTLANAYLLERNVPWTCRSQESSCGDGIDDDCDDLFDGHDDDCATALSFSEIHGGAPDWIEVVNRSTGSANLAGMTIAYRGTCAAGSYTFPSDAIVGPGERYRVVDGNGAGLQARERIAGFDLCDNAGTGGWFALCAGPCDLDGCSNVIDYVEKGAPTSPPACAAFTPAPIDVSSLPASGPSASSIHRTGFAGVGSAGVTTDWTIAAATRD